MILNCEREIGKKLITWYLYEEAKILASENQDMKYIYIYTYPHKNNILPSLSDHMLWDCF